MLDSFEFTLCDMQAHMFELSVEKGYDSESFVRTFMNSDIAKDLDKKFSYAQWAGEAYLLSRFAEENPETKKDGEQYDTEILYWSGYLYRYWHFYTGESSKVIYRQAPAVLIKKVWLPYHAMSVEMAIDRLKETYADRKAKKTNR